MLNRDYILRIVEESVRAIMRARDLRTAGQEAEALNLVERTCENLVGMPARSVIAMPMPSLLMLLKSSDHLDVAKTLALAHLLKEGGMSTHPEAARPWYIRALCLYDEATRAAPGSPEIAPHEPHIRWLVQHL